MNDERNDAALLASVIGICLTTRRIIQTEDLVNFGELEKVLALFAEKMEEAGARLVCLAGDLGIEAEVMNALKEGQDRVVRLKASQGLQGRA